MSRESAFRRTEYYAAVKKRNRIEHCAIVLTEPVADLTNLLFVTRDLSQVEFPKLYLESFADLAGPFHRAARLARHRADLATANPLDRFQCAAFVVDASGTIVRENELGFMLLRSRDAMARGGRLRLGDGLDAALARIGTERAIASPSFFDVEGPESATPLAAMVAVAPIEIANGSTGSLALVLLSDPNRFVCPPAWSLKQEFGLTSAEARFVISFVRSKGIREAARQLGIRWETGRRHLKSVFEKTHTHSQVELTHLLLKHPASVLGEFSAPN
jgi:DNA-binding CsgD family transcriptional regulator